MTSLRKTGLPLVLLVSLSAEFCVINSALGAFEDTGTGARAAALGGAYAALGDDAFSLMYNPASLARVRSAEIVSEYSHFYTGLTDGSSLGQYYMGFSYPLRQEGVLAFGWKQFSLDSLYTERTLSLGYGRWITTRLSAGFAVKQLYHSFGVPGTTVDDAGTIQAGTPTLFAENGNSRSAYTADLGLLYRLTPRYMLATVVQNVNAPNIALAANDADPVPRVIRTGLAYQRPGGLALGAAVSEQDGIPGHHDYAGVGAVEKGWTQKTAAAAVRGSLTLGSRDLRQFSLGFGGRLSNFLFDYAFVFNLSGVGLGETMGTHRFSLSYRLGPMRKKGSLRRPRPGLTKTSAPSFSDEESAAVLSISTGSVGGLIPFTLQVSSSIGGHP